jgi:peptide/nickel transport system substrate-binding protein
MTVTRRRDFIAGLTGAASLSLGLRHLNPITAAQAAEPVRGGNLSAAIVLETASLDPIFGNAGGADRSYYNLYTENLLYQDASGVFHPVLAESWELAPDRLSLMFKLRPGVKFQDGTPFDAAAVKFNLDRVVDPAVGARARQFITDLDSVEVIDPLKVKIKLKRPSGPFLTVLATEPGSMLSPTAVRQRGAEFARSPVGTGPFNIVRWGGGRLEAKRFDGYWGRPAYLDTVTLRVISNTAVKLVELKSGNVQLGDIVQVKDMAEIEADPRLRLVDTIQHITSYISFNNAAEPFKSNLDLRKAISYAVNREAIEKAISRGQGGVLNCLEVPTSRAWSNEIKGHPYDPKLAREAYQRSGHKGPLTIIVIQRDPDTQVAQIVQSMCKAAGIDLRIEVLERLAWVERVLNAKYELGLLRSSSPDPDPDITFSKFYGRSAASDFSHIKNPEIWDMIDRARGLSDMNERRQIYVAIQQKIIDNYWQAYLFWRPQKEVARKELQGFSREYSGAWRYNDMWLAPG